MDKIKRIWEVVRNNPGQVWVVLALVAFWGLNIGFPAEVITSESCAGGACEQMIKEPSLSDSNLRYFQNDVFASSAGAYYRLTFRSRSNQDTLITLSITDILDRGKKLKNFSLKKSESDNFQEVVFAADQKYTDFLFEKEKDGADVLLTDLRVTKLNVKNEAELAKIVPTIFGSIDANIVNQAQTKNNSMFKQLIEPKVILGQVFKAEKDYITEIEMDFNIIQQSGAGKYEFILKEADFEDAIPEIKGDFLTSIKFSPLEAERFRQPNGKFKFPVFQRVTAGNHYFFGINNDRGDVNQFNYLELRGTTERDSYPNGTVAVKKTGETFPVQGSLYFNIFGVEWKEYLNKRILLGETLEDLGGGKMIFKYQPLQKQSAVADLDSFVSEVSYDEKTKALAGVADSENLHVNFIYKFDNPFPFKNLRVFGEKLKPDWSQVNLSYSFDGQNWSVLSEESSIEEGTQKFDQFIPGVFGKNLVYLKIEPQIDENIFQNKKTLKYGVENLQLEGELTNVKKNESD